MSRLINRTKFSDFEDVRMLKWVAHTVWAAPFGLRVWEAYRAHFGSGHTSQSLTGRLRRCIVPKIVYYERFLELVEIQSLLHIFRDRLSESEKNILERMMQRRRRGVHVVMEEGERRRAEDQPENVAEHEMPFEKPQPS